MPFNFFNRPVGNASQQQPVTAPAAPQANGFGFRPNGLTSLAQVGQQAAAPQSPAFNEWGQQSPVAAQAGNVWGQSQGAPSMDPNANMWTQMNAQAQQQMAGNNQWAGQQGPGIRAIDGVIAGNAPGMPSQNNSPAFMAHWQPPTLPQQAAPQAQDNWQQQQAAMQAKQQQAQAGGQGNPWGNWQPPAGEAMQPWGQTNGFAPQQNSSSLTPPPPPGGNIWGQWQQGMQGKQQQAQTAGSLGNFWNQR